MASRILVSPTSTGSRSTIGGVPRLARGRYPRCAHCDQRVALLLQIDLGDAVGAPAIDGRRLIVGRCPTHDAVLNHPDNRRRPLPGQAVRTLQLPEAWWNDPELGHVYFELLPRGADTKEHPPEPLVEAHDVTLEPFEEATAPFESSGVLAGAEGFKIGGAPAFHQYAVRHVCQCSAPMTLVLQVPANHEFSATAPGAPPFLLTLGSQLLLFGCTKGCHPRALWGMND